MNANASHMIATRKRRVETRCSNSKFGVIMPTHAVKVRIGAATNPPTTQMVAADSTIHCLATPLESSTRTIPTSASTRWRNSMLRRRVIVPNWPSPSRCLSARNLALFIRANVSGPTICLRKNTQDDLTHRMTSSYPYSNTTRFCRKQARALGSKPVQVWAESTGEVRDSTLGL